MFKLEYKGEAGYFLTEQEKQELDNILILISNSSKGDGAE